MKQRGEDPDREERIVMQIVVGAFDECERMIG